jgi:hypothetical protein
MIQFFSIDELHSSILSGNAKSSFVVIKLFTMKIFVVLLLSWCGAVANAQEICLRGGKTILPASYVSLRYIQPSNSPLQFGLGAYYERSHVHNLQYSAVGAELMTELFSPKDRFPEKKVSIHSAIGICWQVEREPWLYKDWPLSKRTSFGLMGEVNGYWHLSEAFTLSSFLQQKILFNPLLGRYRLIAGLGVHCRLNTF